MSPNDTKSPSILDRSPIARFVLRRPSLYPPPAVTHDFPDLSPALARAARRSKAWSGPRYWGATAWRTALLEVTGDLAAIARANRPLASGVEAVFSEAARRGATRRDYFSAARGVLAMLLVTAGLLIWWYEYFEPHSLMRLFAGAVWSNGTRYDLEALVVLAGILCTAPFIYLAASRGAAGPRRARVLAVLHTRLAQGQPLSEIMRALRRFFPAHYADLAAAGERTGSLAECLTHLETESAERLIQSRRQRLPFIYLAGVLLAGIGIALFIAVKVLPVFAEIIREFGGDADRFPAYRVLNGWVDGFAYANASHYVVNVVYLAIAAAVFLLARILGRAVGLNAILSRAWLRFTYPGRTAALRSLSQAAALLGRELNAGIPMDECLAHAVASGLHPAHRSVFERVRARMAQGDALGASLRKHGGGLIPASFTAFAELGEASGRLPAALLQIDAMYRPLIAARERIARTVLLSASVLAVGVAVFFVVQVSFLMLNGVTEALLDAI
jgi:type II secretory pathway component PulF